MCHQTGETGPHLSSISQTQPQFISPCLKIIIHFQSYKMLYFGEKAHRLSNPAHGGGQAPPAESSPADGDPEGSTKAHPSSQALLVFIHSSPVRAQAPNIPLRVAFRFNTRSQRTVFGFGDTVLPTAKECLN